MKYPLLYSMVVLLGLFLSCHAGQPETPFSDGTGGLNLQSASDTEIKIPVIYTRSDEVSFDLDPEAFPIAIYRESETTPVKDFPSFADLKAEGMPLVLPVGTYTVKACSFKPVEKVSSEPYFEGIADRVVIEEKTVTNTKITCSFKSLGVELKLSDAFSGLLDQYPENYDYTVKVSNGVATWTFDKTQMKPGFFLEGCDKLVVKVIVRMNGLTYPERTWYFTKNGTDSGEAPGLNEYYVIRLDAKKNEQKMLSCELYK